MSRTGVPSLVRAVGPVLLAASLVVGIGYLAYHLLVPEQTRTGLEGDS